MATFQVTITVPDNIVNQSLDALKHLHPMLPGETNVQFVKRVTKELLIDEAIKGNYELYQLALTSFKPDITTS